MTVDLVALRKAVEMRLAWESDDPDVHVTPENMTTIAVGWQLAAEQTLELIDLVQAYQDAQRAGER